MSSDLPRLSSDLHNIKFLSVDSETCVAGGRGWSSFCLGIVLADFTVGKADSTWAEPGRDPKSN